MPPVEKKETVDHSQDLAQDDLNLPLDGEIGGKKQPSTKEESPLNIDDDHEVEGLAEEGEESEEDQGNDQGEEENPEDEQGEDGQDKGTGEDEEDESFQELPPDQEKKLSPKERAFYRELKKERGKRQKVETERDFLLFQKKYGPSAGKRKVEEEDETPEVWEDPFAGKDPDDVITLKELQAREKSKKEWEDKQLAKSRDKRKKQEAQASAQAAEKAARIKDIETSFRKTHPDYDESLKLAGEVLKKRPSLAIAVQAEMDDPAGDPVSAVYEIAKMHPDFAKPRGKKDTKDNIKRIVRNASRPKTIANMNEQGGAADDLEGMDAEELGKTLATYSEAQLSKVSRKLRDKALRGY